MNSNKLYKRVIQRLDEYSRNDKIPELSRYDSGLLTVLLGPPGAGKSTFYRNYIKHRIKNAKYFSADDLSNNRIKNDPDRFKDDYAGGTSDILKKQISRFIYETGANIVYDTTGYSPRLIDPIVRRAKRNGYDVIFIHKIIPRSEGYNRIQKRNDQNTQSHTDDEYFQRTYSEIYDVLKRYSRVLKEQIKNYYVITLTDFGRRFLKYENGELYSMHRGEYQ